MSATKTDFRVLADVFGVNSVVPNKLRAADLAPLRRCLAAGYCEVVREVLVLTPKGRAVVDTARAEARAQVRANPARSQTERLAAPSAEGGVWVRVASAQASGNPSPRPDRALANEIARVVRPTDRAYVGASLQERCIARVRTISNLVPEVADTVYPLGWLISTGRVSGTFVRTLAKMKAASLGSVTARIHGELSGHGVRSIADAWIAAIAAEAP